MSVSPRVLHGLTHSFPTRRSAGLRGGIGARVMGGSDAAGLRRGQIDALETGAPAAEQLQVRQGIEQRRVADLRAEGDNGCHAAGLFGRQCRGWMLVERPEDFETRSEEHTSELQSLMRISYAV